MTTLRCKSAATGKCKDEDCPHFDEHRKRFDCDDYCFDERVPCEAIEPQQPGEGELISANDTYAATKNMLTEKFTPQCWIAVGAKAQRDHMIQQGWVKLPSEDELADRLRTSFEENGYRNYRETAHELREWLKEQK